MNSEVETLYQEIGQLAIEAAGGWTGKLMIYSEVEENAISADLFYTTSEGTVRFKFCPKLLKDRIYQLWETWQRQPENKVWRVLCYAVNDGEFTIDLKYPDQIDPEEGVPDRRPREIRRNFDKMPIDYSKPR